MAEWPFLSIPESGPLVVMGVSGEERYFDPLGDGVHFTPRFFTKETLALDVAAQRYKLYELDGSIVEFSSVLGLFLRRSDAAGNSVAVVTRTANAASIGSRRR